MKAFGVNKPSGVHLNQSPCGNWGRFPFLCLFNKCILVSATAIVGKLHQLIILWKNLRNRTHLPALQLRCRHVCQHCGDSVLLWSFVHVSNVLQHAVIVKLIEPVGWFASSASLRAVPHAPSPHQATAHTVRRFAPPSPTTSFTFNTRNTAATVSNLSCDKTGSAWVHPLPVKSVEIWNCPDPS